MLSKMNAPVFMRKVVKEPSDHVQIVKCAFCIVFEVNYFLRNVC